MFWFVHFARTSVKSIGNIFVFCKKALSLIFPSQKFEPTSQMQQLRSSNHECVMITGDHPLTSCQVAYECEMVDHKDFLVLAARKGSGQSSTNDEGCDAVDLDGASPTAAQIRKANVQFEWQDADGTPFLGNWPDSNKTMSPESSSDESMSAYKTKNSLAESRTEKLSGDAYNSVNPPTFCEPSWLVALRSGGIDASFY